MAGTWAEVNDPAVQDGVADGQVRSQSVGQRPKRPELVPVPRNQQGPAILDVNQAAAAVVLNPAASQGD